MKRKSLREDNMKSKTLVDANAGPSPVLPRFSCKKCLDDRVQPKESLYFNELRELFKHYDTHVDPDEQSLNEISHEANEFEKNWTFCKKIINKPCSRISTDTSPQFDLISVDSMLSNNEAISVVQSAKQKTKKSKIDDSFSSIGIIESSPKGKSLPCSMAKSSNTANEIDSEISICDAFESGKISKKHRNREQASYFSFPTLKVDSKKQVSFNSNIMVIDCEQRKSKKKKLESPSIKNVKQQPSAKKKANPKSATIGMKTRQSKLNNNSSN